MTLLRILILLFPACLCSCSAFYRIEVPSSTQASVPRSDAGTCEGLREFWLANGFERFGEAFVFGAAPRVTANPVALATWVKDYPGWLFPSSGQVWGTEVSENETCVVHVYSNRREAEAAEVAENLRRWLMGYHPTADVRVETSHFVDVR